MASAYNSTSTVSGRTSRMMCDLKHQVYVESVKDSRSHRTGCCCHLKYCLLSSHISREGVNIIPVEAFGDVPELVMRQKVKELWVEYYFNRNE
jgi:hypothetical protein